MGGGEGGRVEKRSAIAFTLVCSILMCLSLRKKAEIRSWEAKKLLEPAQLLPVMT